MKFISLFGIFLLILKSTVHCRITDDNVSLKKGWAFLQKFAFFAREGQYFLNVTVNNVYDSNFIVVIYINFENEWNKFYSTQPTCENLLSNNQLFHQIVYLKNYSVFISTQNNVTSYYANNILSTNGKSAYTFSLILACDRTNQDFSVRINSILTNGNQNEFFRYHFSADEFYILESSIAFFIFYLFIIAIFAFYRVYLIREHRASVLTILIGAVIFIKCFVFFCQFIIFLNYGLYGIFSYTAFIIFELLNQYTVLIFMELVILLGFGLTIIFGKMSYRISIIIFIFGIVYLVLLTVVFVIHLNNYDPAYANNIYDQFCGYVLVAIQFLMAIIFVIACSIMIAKQEDRRTFYGIFMVVIFLWFISVPVLILVSLNYIAVYVRFATVFIVRNVLDSLVHIIYIIITFPNLCPNLVMYTTPASKIVDITFGEALQNADKVANDIQTNNNQFFDISEFQFSET